MTKEQKRIHNKNYREKNRDKINAKNKLYRETHKAERKKYLIENKEKIAIQKKAHREANKEKERLQCKIYKETHKKEVNIKAKIYRDNHKEEQSVRNKKFRELHKDELNANNKVYKKNNRSKINDNEKLRKKTDPLFKLSKKMRSTIKSALKRGGYKKASKTTEIIGCSFEYLKTFIESKFEPWMNWDNHGKYNGKFNYGWDIDHKTPLSSATTEEELLKLCHYTNLQPLCSYVNRHIKRNKIDFVNVYSSALYTN